MYSLKQAADAVGRGKPAILKAIKSGRISAKKDDNGQWQIDPAELHRVYPMAAAGNGSDTAPGVRQETPKERSDIGSETKILLETIADLRNERDRLLTIVETQAAQVKQLTDQRQPERRGWWPWRRGK